MWSWALTLFAMYGLWLTGLKDARCWWVSLAAQGLWMMYAITTHQYGFIVSSVAYSAMAVRNLRLWREEEKKTVPA